MNQQVTPKDFEVSNGFYRIQANGRYACIHKGSYGWSCRMRHDATCEVFGPYVYSNKLYFRTLKEAKQHGANYING